MKTPNDTSTLDMLPNGAPAFDLNPEDAWPTPPPLPEWKPKLIEPTLREWLFGLVKR